jgi:hypothetical protein
MDEQVDQKEPQAQSVTADPGENANAGMVEKIAEQRLHHISDFFNSPCRPLPENEVNQHGDIYLAGMSIKARRQEVIFGNSNSERAQARDSHDDWCINTFQKRHLINLTYY